MTRVKTWVKISKVMPQSKSISPGKGGKPYGKRSKSLVYNMVWLNRTYYSLFKLQTKFSKLSSPVKFQRITQIPRSSPTQSVNYAKFAPFANTTPYVSGTCPGREHCRIPANYANSTQFTHTVCELRKIRTFC